MLVECESVNSTN